MKSSCCSCSCCSCSCCSCSCCSIRPRVGELSEPCCSNWDMHLWKDGGGPLLELIPPNSCFNIVGRDSEDMEVTQRRAPSLHLGHIAAGSGHQKTKQATFFKTIALMTPRFHYYLLYIFYIVSVPVSFTYFMSRRPTYYTY